MSDIVGVRDDSGILISCQLCGALENLMRCSRCRLAYYCSRDHQKKHWKEHKRICGKENRDTSNTNCNGKPSSAGKVMDTRNTKVNSQPSFLTSVPKRTSLTESLELKSEDSLKNSEKLEGSSENEILRSDTEVLKVRHDYLHVVEDSGADMDNLNSESNILQNSQSSRLNGNQVANSTTAPVCLHNNKQNKIPGESTVLHQMCQQVIEDMDKFGICVIDNFLGSELGTAILDEVLAMYERGVFHDGQLVKNKTKDSTKTIRGDKIHWFQGSEEGCEHLKSLINFIDNIIITCNKWQNNGKLGDYEINERTKVGIIGRGKSYF